MPKTEFRLLVRLQDELSVSKVIDGLSDDALRVTMDLGVAVLNRTTGIDFIIKAMEDTAHLT